jgi:ketosteroid isomerase-like protein
MFNIQSVVCRAAILTVGLSCVGVAGAHAQTDSDVAAVMAANNGYYAAISTLDASAMEKVWAHESYVDNVGPQHKTMQFGWDAIQEAFKNGTIVNSAQLTVKSIDPKVHINGNVAWVIGQELADGTLKSGTRVTGMNFAISLFEKKDGRWLMVSHHGQRAPQ